MSVVSSRVDAGGVCELGEGPHWDVETQNLYYVDIFGKTVHRYNPSSGEHVQASAGDEPVSIIIPIEGKQNRFVITSGRKVLAVEWDGKSGQVGKVEKIAEVDTEGPARNNRINDGKCDPSGRLWFGTMGHEPVVGDIAPQMGSLYSMDPNGHIKRHLDKLGIANGLAWNADATKMYYIDSFSYTVDELDFNIEKGTVANRRPIFSLKEHGIGGIPDGMTIDVEGNLWVANFEGGAILKIDPRKPETLLQRMEVAAKQPTSVAFGGANLEDLYVTSARLNWKQELLPPDNGSVYKLTGLSVRGCPAVKVKLM